MNGAKSTSSNNNKVDIAEHVSYTLYTLSTNISRNSSVICYSPIIWKIPVFVAFSLNAGYLLYLQFRND